MIAQHLELTVGQLAALYLEALRLSDTDPEAAIAARNLGEALDRRRGSDRSAGAVGPHSATLCA